VAEKPHDAVVKFDNIPIEIYRGIARFSPR